MQCEAVVAVIGYHGLERFRPSVLLIGRVNIFEGWFSFAD
jgi:hypothetical protein